MFGVSSAELVTILPVLIVVLLLLGMSYALFLMYNGSSGQ
jgi:flagellar basal body-associated protein FliL